jgi:hypothetical protein
VCLKASSDLRASTFASVKVSTCPSSSASLAAVPFSLLSSCSPLTSIALVLLNTTFLRSAFLSPGAGGLPVVSRLFLFNRRVVPWREVGLATAPFFFGGLAASEGEVEKAARWTALMDGDEVSIDRYEREIHREQIDCDIAVVGVYLCLAIDTNADSVFPNLQVAREVRESLLLRRFTPRDPPCSTSP